MAKTTWVFYAFYYFTLYFSQWWNSGEWTSPYGVAFLMGVAVFFFIGLVRKQFFEGELRSEIEKAGMSVKQRAAGLRAEADRLDATTGIKQS